MFAAFFLLPAVYAQTGGLKGKVRTNSGFGIANATVTARQDGKDIRTVRSDAKGNFLMEGLDSGKYNVVFDANGYSSGVLYNVEVKKKNIRNLGDRLILSIDQGTQVIIKGSVFFSTLKLYSVQNNYQSSGVAPYLPSRRMQSLWSGLYKSSFAK